MLSGINLLITICLSQGLQMKCKLPPPVRQCIHDITVSYLYGNASMTSRFPTIALSKKESLGAKPFNSILNEHLYASVR